MALLTVLLEQSFTPAQVVTVLRDMGWPWSYLSGDERRQPPLPEHPIVEPLLQKIEPLGAIISWAPPRKGTIRVQVRDIS